MLPLFISRAPRDRVHETIFPAILFYYKKEAIHKILMPTYYYFNLVESVECRFIHVNNVNEVILDNMQSPSSFSFNQSYEKPVRKLKAKH